MISYRLSSLVFIASRTFNEAPQFLIGVGGSSEQTNAGHKDCGPSDGKNDPKQHLSANRFK
jgi:hypothetical protein